MNEDKEKEINKIVKLVNSSEISSIKQVASGLINIIDDPESTAKDLKNIIELDPPLTSKVLRIANSVYYSIQRKVQSIEHAVILIGFDEIKELALKLKICEIFSSEDSIGEYTRISLWKHSIAVGLLSRMIYRREFRMRGENIYIAGLLHEIGIIVEDQFLHNDFKKILHKAKIEKKNLLETEYEILGYNHAELGKALTNHWKFPRDIVMGIGYHHNPTQAPQEFSKMASTLYISNYLCQEKGIGYCNASFDDHSVYQECLKKLDLEPYSLDLVMRETESELSKLENQELFI